MKKEFIVALCLNLFFNSAKFDQICPEVLKIRSNSSRNSIEFTQKFDQNIFCKNKIRPTEGI